MKNHQLYFFFSNKSHPIENAVLTKICLCPAFLAHSSSVGMTGPHTASSNITGRLSVHSVSMMDCKCLLHKLVYPDLSFSLSQETLHCSLITVRHRAVISRSYLERITGELRVGVIITLLVVLTAFSTLTMMVKGLKLGDVT